MWHTGDYSEYRMDAFRLRNFYIALLARVGRSEC